MGLWTQISKTYSSISFKTVIHLRQFGPAELLHSLKGQSYADN